MWFRLFTRQVFAVSALVATHFVVLSSWVKAAETLALFQYAVEPSSIGEFTVSITMGQVAEVAFEVKRFLLLFS
jgi:hypothetical protein